MLNFAYSSGGINEEMLSFVANKIDLKEKGCNAIILGLTPFSLSTEARKNEQFHEESNRPIGEILERKYKLFFLKEFEPINLNHLLARNDEEESTSDYRANGWVKSSKIPENNREALSIYKKEFLQNKFDSTSYFELLDFVKTMTSKNVTIFGFRPPTTAAMEQLEDSLSGYNEQSIKSEFVASGGVWIDIENRYGYRSYDGSHLHFESANRLSSYLKAQISRYCQ